MNDFWEFLESIRIPDTCLAEGYEQAGPELRGHLKKNMAAQHKLMEQRLPPERTRLEIAYDGTVCGCASAPAPWCLLVHDAAYAAAPRARAAAVPAQLAGVPVIWSIALHGEGTPALPPAAVLAAWELAGIENVAAIDAPAFLSHLSKALHGQERSAQGPGRVLILGAPQWAQAMRGLVNDERKALLRQEGRAPRILLTGSQSESYYQTLCALHPDAEIRLDQGEDAGAHSAANAYDAVLAQAEAAGQADDGALHMDYEHCGCWIWPELGATFFVNHSFSLVGKL